MNYGHWLSKIVKMIGLTLILGVSMSACASGGTVSWKEEVLLHDGEKLIVERSQTRGGRREFGQELPIKEHTLTFTLPMSYKFITWKDEFSNDIGHSNFNLLALHILNGTPYIVTSPDGQIAYKNWGRPNPPYVFFKYSGTWQRIAHEEFPIEFKNINLVINTLAHEKELNSQNLTSSEMVKKLNSSLTQDEYKGIRRIPLDHWKPRPEHKGPKAPHPIAPPNTIDEKNRVLTQCASFRKKEKGKKRGY